MTYSTSRTEEQWRPVPGYEGLYDVSDQGRVRSLPRPGTRARVIKAQMVNGYPTVHLWRQGELQAWKVHRLVASAWHRLPLPGEVCRHLNGTPTDNRPENLAWGTVKDNCADTLRMGRHSQQRKTHCPKGHPYSAGNTYRKPGGRRCKTCHNDRRKAPLRPDVCTRGHSMADARVTPRQRVCRPCEKQRKAEYLARKRAAA